MYQKEKNFEYDFLLQERRKMIEVENFEVRHTILLVSVELLEYLNLCRATLLESALGNLGSSASNCLGLISSHLKCPNSQNFFYTVQTGGKTKL